jgi:diguanylate cyclase (GGDEF)-like protein
VSAPAGDTRPTLLCIDDDRVQRLTVGHIVASFRHQPYRCEFASTYDEGLRKLSFGTYAACLLDDQLDQQDGLELLREARRINPDTPVIIITSSDTEEVDMAASEIGAADFLLKSELNTRVLERTIRYAVKLGETLKQLRAMALRDELTGLLNRRELQALLLDEWVRTSRFLRPFSIGLADIDSFKRINDEYGHPVGDKVICHVGHLFASRLRRVDRVARFGGEEFAMLMPETGRREATIAMERMRSTLEITPCVIPELGLSIPVTVSIGLAVSLEDADSPDGLIPAADKRLYIAKNAGRNRLCSEG